MLTDKMADTCQRMERTRQQMLVKQQEMRELHAEITEVLASIERDKRGERIVCEKLNSNSQYQHSFQNVKHHV